MSVTLTDDMIRSAASPEGGWTQEQLRLIGVPWPPPKGWTKQAVGRKLDHDAIAEFIALAHTDPAKAAAHREKHRRPHDRPWSPTELRRLEHHEAVMSKLAAEGRTPRQKTFLTLPVPGVTTAITDSLLDAAAGAKGFFSPEQYALLRLPPRPTAGWKQKVIGKTIPVADADKLLEIGRRLRAEANPNTPEGKAKAERKAAARLRYEAEKSRETQ